MRTAFPNSSMRARRPAFTLLEILIAVSVFAIVLGAINAVFFSALRLRNRAAASLEKSLPVEQTLAIIKRDLSSIVPPGEVMAGPLQTRASTNAMAAASSPVFFCASGMIDETSPWAEIQKVSYALAESTNRTLGKDLVRLVDRNLLAVTPEQPIAQILLAGVETMTFSFYDGAEWRTDWDSTIEEPKLPLGIKVQIQLAGEMDRPSAPRPMPLELVVPVMVSASTNATEQTETDQQ